MWRVGLPSGPKVSPEPQERLLSHTDSVLTPMSPFGSKNMSRERHPFFKSLRRERKSHTLPGTHLITSLRRSRLAALCSVFSLGLLLFPILSTADDFHVCRLFRIPQANLGQAEFDTLNSTPSVTSEDDGVCLACLWTTIESTMPTAFASLPALLKRIENFVPRELSFALIQTHASKPERAPPLS